MILKTIRALKSTFSWPRNYRMVDEIQSKKAIYFVFFLNSFNTDIQHIKKYAKV